ncbi:Ig-like domain-containing protein [Paucibacter sp. KBW04]|uniref:Ig-like domain-containing protein n=1 Tax=Paucibacter sp. KBW04 TaxID=2153361 RepID=UPI0018CC23FC|nr:Ig-like domain-containing protein [Paucibacter sp. KBW04]
MSRLNMPQHPRKHLVSLLLAASLVACGGGGGGGGGGNSSPAPAAPSVSDFPLAVGDRWTYQSSTDGETHVRILSAALVDGHNTMLRRTQDSNGDADEYLERLGDSVNLLPGPNAGALEAAVGSVTLLQLPLVAGKSFKLIDKTISQDVDGDGKPDNIKILGEASVADVQSLSVPAGTFETVVHVKSTVTLTITSGANGKSGQNVLVSDDWYAQGVGLLKSSSINTFADGQVERHEQTLSHYHAGTRRSDSVAPKVLTRSPAPDSAAQFSLIEVTFDEDMDPLSSTADALLVTNASGSAITGNLVWHDKRRLAFSPTMDMPSGNYKISLANRVEDLAGNPVAAEAWSFRIDKDGPVLLSVSPAADAKDVPLDSAITLRFNEPVDAATAQAGIALYGPDSAGIAADITVEGSIVTLKPRALLVPAHRYLINIRVIKDTAGNEAAIGTSIYFTTDPGLFGTPSLMPGMELAPVKPYRALVADLNGDGRADLLYQWVENPYVDSKTSLKYFVQQADGSLLLAGQWDDGKECMGDLLANPLPAQRGVEVLRAGPCGFQQWRMNEVGKLALVNTPSAPDYGALLSGTWIRMAVDGGLRAVVADKFNGTDYVRVLIRQTAPGVFAAPQAMPRGHAENAPTVADFNGDGREDLLVLGGIYTDQVSGPALYLQQADGSFVRQAKPEWSAYAQATPIDINGDGLIDIAFTTSSNQASHQVELQLQQPDGSFTPGTLLALETYSQIDALRSLDLDGNGKQDLLAITADTLLLLRQGQDAKFIAVQKFSRSPGDGGTRDIQFGDLNGDGRTDIVLGGSVFYQRPPSLASRALGAGRAWRSLAHTLPRTLGQ